MDIEDIGFWKSILIALNEVNIMGLLINSFGAFLGALGVVYLLGRMMEYAMDNKSRNRIAYIMIIINSFFFLIRRDPMYTSDLVFFFQTKDLFVYFTDVAYNSMVGFVWYVWIGFNIYSRVDRLLDKKIGENDVSVDSCTSIPATPAKPLKRRMKKIPANSKSDN